MGGEEEGEIIILFGVRVKVVEDYSLRKTVSLNNLSQYEPTPLLLPNHLIINKDKDYGGGGGGYVSADEAVPHHSSKARPERKRGVAWTEEEHKLFLMGLKKVGKGDWRAISRNFVKTRTPTQVASHAQKYFLRRNNLNTRRRRRSSLFDITTDQLVSEIPVEEEQAHDEEKNTTGSDSNVLTSPQHATTNVANFSELPAFPAVQDESKVENFGLGKGSEAGIPSANLIRPIPFIPVPCASPVCDLNLDLNLSPTVEPSPLSLKLSLASDWRETSSKHSAFHVIQSYKNGDTIVSVA